MRGLFLFVFSFPYVLWGSIQPPKAFPVLEKEGFCLQYDSRGKIPLWTWEVLTKESLEESVKRDGIPFRPESGIPLVAQAQLKDYRGSGFDRGHMVPAGVKGHQKYV